jgi:choline dehydrogenase-like flavoprotein
MSTDSADFDAIVVGSGMSGGWAAKELCERGLKTLVIERGRHVEHGPDYTDALAPWEIEQRGRVSETEIAEHYSVQSKCYAFNTANKHFWVRDSDHPYETPDDKPFVWIRGYHLGGRSLLWARHSYRWGDLDFESNLRDGHGVDWPIRYADIAPWYDRAERFAGVSGTPLGLPQTPDGVFQPPMALNAVEKDFKAKVERRFPGRKFIMGRVAHLTQPTEEQLALGRGQCQYRDHCYRGCSFGAYFSSLSATLPAAQRTGNLTVVTDAIVHSVSYDPATGHASGVRVIDANTRRTRSYTARVIFLCASTIGTTQIMLNSASEQFPDGIANRSGALGRYLMDHVSGLGAQADVTGFDDRYYAGRRPAGIYMPRYRNVSEPTDEFVRGYGFQGGAMRPTWQRGASTPGVGVELKQRLRAPDGWRISLNGFGEMLPRADNRITLSSRRDKWGIPLVRIECSYGENELKLAARANQDALEMLQAAGYANVRLRHPAPAAPGYGIHEMGTARMGRDPATSVLNGWNQAHDVANLFVTDGACMASSACQNPSLTYMALSARAANHAADLLAEGAL